jgi:C1A family cysteine protease
MPPMQRVSAALVFLVLVCGPHEGRSQIPSSYDLRDVAGECFVTPVKDQPGGTCWAFATMASVESNLLLTGAWDSTGEPGVPDLAEYHLDWWNGFNTHNNDDRYPASGGGLVVHQGGDFFVSTAYLARGEGAVRESDGGSYDVAPPRFDDDFRRFRPRHVEWRRAAPGLTRIDEIKRALMDHGAVSSCIYVGGPYFEDNVHYQPPESNELPNHAVAIVGWDDAKATQAPEPGAWICKNSWGADWGADGYLWVSFLDRWCCQEPDMGAVVFRDAEPMPYECVYSHDYHGWRATFDGYDQAVNSFTAAGDFLLQSVCVYTTGDSVAAAVRVYDAFAAGELSGLLASASDTFAHRGMHTMDVDVPVAIPDGDDFHVVLEIDGGGLAYDCTSDVPVLLGARYRVTVVSAASPGQSFYLDGGAWLDLTGHDLTANFCISALGVRAGLSAIPQSGFESWGDVGGPFSPDTVRYVVEYRGDSPVEYEVAADPWLDWVTLSGATEGILEPHEPVFVRVSVNEAADGLPPGTHGGDIRFRDLTNGGVDIERRILLAVGDRSICHEWPMDADPGWDYEMFWEYGQPTGGGGLCGGPDPSAGRTGACVVGYNLDGDYTNNLVERNAETGPIDCSGITGATLRFWRWLGVGDPSGDHAYVRASRDGLGWVTLWENESEIADTAWVPVEFDISPVADGEESLRLRWTMGRTDSDGKYCGWNIDDVRILGFDREPTGIDGPGGTAPGARLDAVRPNPFSPSTEISFAMGEAGPACVAVYDVAGRIVRKLADGRLDAGGHTLSWDGRDDGGRGVASGVYFLRLATGRGVVTRKMVVIR